MAEIKLEVGDILRIGDHSIAGSKQFALFLGGKEFLVLETLGGVRGVKSLQKKKDIKWSSLVGEKDKIIFQVRFAFTAVIVAISPPGEPVESLS